jgi:hypothetical protein
MISYIGTIRPMSVGYKTDPDRKATRQITEVLLRMEAPDSRGREICIVKRTLNPKDF